MAQPQGKDVYPEDSYFHEIVLEGLYLKNKLSINVTKSLAVGDVFTLLMSYFFIIA